MNLSFGILFLVLALAHGQDEHLIKIEYQTLPPREYEPTNETEPAAKDPRCGSSNDIKLLFEEVPTEYHVGCINEEVLNSFMEEPVLINALLDCWINGNLCENDVHMLFVRTIEQLTEGLSYTGGPIACNHLCGDKAVILEKAARTFRRRHEGILRRFLKHLGYRL